MSTKDGSDSQKPSVPEHQSLKAFDVEGARNASGEVIRATEATRTNASDGSLRDRTKPIAERDDSIQIMGVDGRAASRTNRLSESELVGRIGQDPATRSIDIRELLAKPEKTAQALVEEFGRVTNMPAGADRDAAFAQVQQLADKTYGRGQFANRDRVSGAEPAADKIQIGGRLYDRNEILASNNGQQDLVTDATGALVFETNKGNIESKPFEKISPKFIESGLDYNTKIPISEKLAVFANSATARLLDSVGRKAYFQGMIDETFGVGEGLNMAEDEVKESTKVAATKAWTALTDGSVSSFMATPNAINEPLFKTIGSCLDTMARDPNAVNNVLAVMGRELQSASDKYSKMSPHDRGLQNGKAMFFFINPEGSTEAVDLAAKVGQRVAPHVENVVGAGMANAGKVSTEFLSTVQNAANVFDQAAQDFMQSAGPRLQTAGGPPDFFDRPALQIEKASRPGQQIDVNYMSKADGPSGGMERPVQGLPGGDLSSNLSPENIVNPIDRNASVEEKLRQLQQLSKENDSLIREFTARVDSKLGSHSSEPNFKAPEDIELKAKRPDILEKRPWFQIEHVRDSLRFKTVASNLEDLPKIIQELKASKFDVIDAQLNKLLEPKGRGWRMAAIDLRAPNGQIMEYQVLPPEMQEAGKIEHEAYKGWREKDVNLLTRAERNARDKADKAAIKMYRAAWNAYLARTRQTNEEIRDIIADACQHLQ